MAEHKLLYLNKDDVKAAGGEDLEAAIKAAKYGLLLHGKGDCVQPPKINLRKGPPGSPQAEQGLIMAMPGYVGGDLDIIGIKWLLAMAENPTKYGLPRSSALIILNHPDNGLPIAIMDGTIVNIVRTGSVTAVGARYLANKNARSIGLVGAGPQGRMQILSLARVLPRLEEVYIFDIVEKKAEALAEELSCTLSIKVKAVGSSEAALSGRDVLVTATITKTPYVEACWLAPGSFYADIASSDAKIEVYKSADKIFTDDLEQMIYLGVGVLPNAIRRGEVDRGIVTANFGEVLAGVCRGRESEEERIIFKHIGMSVTDLTVAYEIYLRAKEKKLGTTLTL